MVEKMKIKNKEKNSQGCLGEKAITLIALVITIIVLLILARSNYKHHNQ